MIKVEAQLVRPPRSWLPGVSREFSSCLVVESESGVTWLSRVHHGALLWTSLIVQKCGGLHFTHSQYLKCFFLSRVSAIGNSMGNSVKLHLKSKDPAAFGLLWDVFPPVIQRSLREDVDFMNFLPLCCGWNPGGPLHLRSHHILWDSLQLYRLSDRLGWGIPKLLVTWQGDGACAPFDENCSPRSSTSSTTLNTTQRRCQGDMNLAPVHAQCTQCTNFNSCLVLCLEWFWCPLSSEAAAHLKRLTGWYLYSVRENFVCLQARPERLHVNSYV